MKQITDLIKTQIFHLQTGMDTKNHLWNRLP